MVASIGGALTDIEGSFLGTGPEAALLGNVPGAGIGFLEAHGLALIIVVLLWRAEPTRNWHIAGAAVHALLAAANLAFSEFFVVTDVVAVGYVTTALHGLFVLLHLAVVFATSVRSPVLATFPRGGFFTGIRQ